MRISDWSSDVCSADLSTALKGASETLRELFFSNMSERAAKILREDMAAMGPVRLRDVDEAQMDMVNLAQDLAAKGERSEERRGGNACVSTCRHRWTTQLLKNKIIDKDPHTRQI